MLEQVPPHRRGHGRPFRGGIRSVLALGLVVALSAGCDRSDQPAARFIPPPGWAGTITDSAGVAIIANPAGRGLWARGEGWAVSEELRIGTAVGPVEYQFGKILGVAMDERGRVYVVDGLARNVRAFAPDGRFLYVAGRAGAGPGELSGAPGGVFVGPADTLIVPDLVLSRVNWYAEAGSSSGSFPPFPLGGLNITGTWRPHPDGLFWSDVVNPSMDEGRPWMVWIVVRDARGAPLDTLLVSEYTPPGMMSGYTIRMLAPTLIWGIGPGGGLAHGLSSGYRIHVHGPDGGVDRIITREAGPEAVSRGDADQLARWAREGLSTVGAIAPLPPVRLDYSDGLPVVMDLRTGPSGTLWVQRGVSSTDLARAARDGRPLWEFRDFGSRTWDVFDSVGFYLGPIELPSGFRLIAVHGGRLLGVQTGELGEEYAAVLRVDRGAP